MTLAQRDVWVIWMRMVKSFFPPVYCADKYALTWNIETGHYLADASAN